eukprot:Hpha_TRINITY_DN33863_c0_g1::TRINITY_DN33863_c0_g1_i1::g.27316::m.27316
MGFGGTSRGSFFEAAEWVDMKKPPGHTPMGQPTASSMIVEAIWQVVTLQAFFFSPNLVWALIALGTHIIVPYDLAVAKEWHLDWVATRALVNLGLFFSYYGFWSVTLYLFRVCSRKYKPEHTPPLARLLHNIWYSALGCVQLTVWEVVFMHLWATGKVGTTSDEEMLSTWQGGVSLLLWTIALPVLHDFHFYFIHRFLHVRVLYKYVHSLHHRNNDIEPFCGLAMHPVEHSFFFAGLGASLYFGELWTPWLFRWSLVWLMLAPGASHSGWEDHFNADQWHYLHHARYECNYGSPGFPMDMVCGTARRSLVDGGAAGRPTSVQRLGEDAKPVQVQPSDGGWSSGGGVSAEWALPDTPDQAAFWLLTTAAYLAFFASVFLPGRVDRLAAVWGDFAGDSVTWSQAVAGGVSGGALLWGTLLRIVSGDGMSWRWPFHRESLFILIPHLIIGFACAVLPTYHSIEALLS